MYQTITPKTVRLPEVQFTITPQFDLIMLPNNEVKNHQEQPAKAKKTKKNSIGSPVMTTKQKALKPILPKDGFQNLSLENNGQIFEDNEAESIKENVVTATETIVPEPDMPSFASPQKQAIGENR